MLKTMRKNVKALKPTLWIVIATFIISIFVIWGGAGRLGEARRPGDRWRPSAAGRSPRRPIFNALRQTDRGHAARLQPNRPQL